MALNWIIAGGGTGGHVTPALALGEAIAERGEHVAFIGSEQGLESKWVPEAGFELIALPSQQVMGRGFWGRVTGLIRTLMQVGRARSALRTSNCFLSLPPSNTSCVASMATSTCVIIRVA